MWDLPGPRIEPVSPALAGRFLTTVPPGKSLMLFYFLHKVSLYLFFFCLLAFGLPLLGEEEQGFVSLVPESDTGLVHGRSSGNNL